MAKRRRASFAPPGMVLEGNVLRIRKELQWGDYHPFEDSCRELLGAPGSEVIVDLTSSGHMFSTVIGILAATAVEARQKQKKLILRIPEGLMWVASTSGLTELLEVETEA